MKKSTYLCFLLVSAAAFSGCLKDYENPSAGTVNSKAELYVVRQAHQGADVQLTEKSIGGARVTSGVVISDKTASNLPAGQFVIQNTTVTANSAGDLVSGLLVDMGSDPAVPALGDSVVIDVIGSTLKRVGGTMVLSGVTASKINVVASNKVIAPVPVTLGMLNTNFAAYESTLIAVHADVLNATTTTTYSGEKTLDDHTGRVTLSTREGASFANATVPADAQFTGIALYKNTSGNDTAGAKKTIVLRRSADVNFVSGTMYANFPESFETPDASAKSSYNITTTANNIDLASGNWKLQQAILGNTLLSDKINPPGKQAIRMQQNLSTVGLVQMNFDVTQGASKLTLFYAKYSTDPTSTFRLEYSINGGTTWIAVAPDIKDMPEKGSKQATYMLNLTGNVRFRINKPGLGTSSATVFNGRLNLDDIAIYRK